MSTKEVILTLQGVKKFEEELENLKTVRRHEVAGKIKRAREFGDLSENAEYDAAKDEQAKVEARISHLENLLKNVKVVDEEDLNTDTISVGVKVKIKNMASKQEMEFMIVGSSEANPAEGKMSDESPIGSALIGKSIGDTIVVDVPAGQVKFKIISIVI